MIIRSMSPLLHWLSRRDLRLLHVLGAALGWLAYSGSPSYRRRLRENAAQAGLTPAQRRASVAEAGRMSAELPRLWLRPRHQPIADPVRWEGADLIETFVERGRGMLLLTPHMGSFEIAAQAFAERFGTRMPLTVLYRPARQAWLRTLEETARARPALSTAPADLSGVRQLIRALRRGEAVGLLPDQVPPEGMGVWAPFFGRPAYTMTLASRLAQQTGASLGVVWAERLPRGAGYVVRVLPMPVDLPQPRAGQDEAAHQQAAATAMNQAMEAVIRLRPEQYLWGYNRYKPPRRPGSRGGAA
jgi:KDO2-lipid IV(A) lauroyltransferase